MNCKYQLIVQFQFQLKELNDHKETIKIECIQIPKLELDVLMNARPSAPPAKNE